MPAVYAHYRFGAKVSRKLEGDLKEIVTKYHPQFAIGLQGPDIFFFYRPFGKNAIIKYGNHLHEIPARSFFEHGLKVVREKGRDSREYAYLLGFLCHFILDSECHPYVNEMIEKIHVQHLEIEEEFEKKLLRLDGKDPFAYEMARLIPTDQDTAQAASSFYEGISPETARCCLRWMKRIKRLLTTPGEAKFQILNTLMKAGGGKYPYYKGLLTQRTDNMKCEGTNLGLWKRFLGAEEVAVSMIRNLDESLREEAKLSERFDRTFE